MEKTIRILAALVLGTTLFSNVQRGSAHSPGNSHSKRAWAESISRQTSKLNASDDQRLAILKCVETTERARKLINQIVGPGTRWRYDFKIFPGREEQLRSALSEMTVAHQQFREALTEEQGRVLANHLNRLDRLQLDLNAHLAALDHELIIRHPDWRRLYADSHQIKEAADKWLSEHKKIAKDMSISRLQSPRREK